MSKRREFVIPVSTAEVDLAIREGRHSATFTTVCDGCRQWCDGIYHVTPTRMRLCRDCAASH